MMRPHHFKETIMRYVCLVYAEPEAFERLSEAEQSVLNRDSLAYDKELEKNGHYIHADALQSVGTAVTVRVRDKRISTTDGPFAETKEHLCGFILVEAADQDEAVRLASGVPMARIGSVEVRPVYKIPGGEAS
jgi:hypothetical protein